MLQTIDRAEIIHEKMITYFQTGIFHHQNTGIVSEFYRLSDAHLFYMIIQDKSSTHTQSDIVKKYVRVFSQDRKLLSSVYFFEKIVEHIGAFIFFISLESHKYNLFLHK